MSLSKQSQNALFSYVNLVHAVAGAVGSTVALTTFFPLDTVQTRNKVEDKKTTKFSLAAVLEILRNEGLAALYNGWRPMVISLWCSNFVYFYTFSFLKRLRYQGGRTPNAKTDLILAFISGVINVLTTTPLWVANTRLKLQGVRLNSSSDKAAAYRQRSYSGMIDCILKIIKQEGFFSLWSGALPSLFLVSNPSIHFMVYEAEKRYMLARYTAQELSGVIYFLMGALAKMMATVTTYPMQVIQARSRAGLNSGNKKSMRGIFQEIINVHGLGGLYRGLEAKLTQTVLMAALMFLTYEKIAAFVFQLMGLKKPLNK